MAAGSDTDDIAAETLDGKREAGGVEAAPSNPTPRTIMVKERVKEEKTYMDARGYLVCEEVWVEREVEKTVTEAQAAAAASKPKVQIRAEQPKARPKGKEPRGMVTEDAEIGANKEKKSAKAKAAPPPIKGAQSIMGFFGKK